ncbi:MAG: RNA polymerase subunit sigma-24 [Syntrophus sp. (in: bacteria)]|nr:RNA polymerase subunit sigma-24 [Syntrophus sp. (in: bacteria)]
MNEKKRVSTDDDAEYVTRCQKGHIDAFEILVERHQKKMINIAYRMIGDYDEACDITQEAFLSAYRSIKKFRGEAKFSTWLTGITINHTKNRLRQLQSRSYHEVISLDDPVETESGTLTYDPPAREASAIEQLEQKEVQAKVQGCINTLDTEYKQVLVLRDIEGFSYEEISDILKIPDGTVKSRLFRARGSVKNCLKKILGDI